MKELYINCLNPKFEANPLKINEMAGVFVLHDLGGSHVCLHLSLTAVC